MSSESLPQPFRAAGSLKSSYKTLITYAFALPIALPSPCRRLSRPSRLMHLADVSIGRCAITRSGSRPRYAHEHITILLRNYAIPIAKFFNKLKRVFASIVVQFRYAPLCILTICDTCSVLYYNFKLGNF